MTFLLGSTWLAITIWLDEYGWFLLAAVLASVAWRPGQRENWGRRGLGGPSDDRRGRLGPTALDRGTIP